MMADFAPQDVLEALERHGVRYVVIGGLAAILHGAPHVTTDVDIVPEAGRANLERLSEALKELNARIRVAGEPEGIPFDHSGESLMRVQVWNLVTDRGNVDIAFVPTGTRGYEDLVRDVEMKRVRDMDIPVASLADVVRSKEAAGRDRDRLVLPVLRRILDESSSRSASGRKGTE
jgi:hypothetical protein